MSRSSMVMVQEGGGDKLSRALAATEVRGGTKEGPVRAASATPLQPRWRAEPRLRAAGNETACQTQLRRARVGIERAKVSAVPAWPFVGRSMHFEDDTSSLTICNDGRFTFSIFPRAPSIAEVRAGLAKEKPRRVVTVEGVCTSTPFSLLLQAEKGASDPSPAGDAAAPAGDPETRAVEAQGLLWHEDEEWAGNCELLTVDTAESRFAISLTPFFDPVRAVVQPLSVASLPVAFEKRQELLAVPVPGSEQSTSGGSESLTALHAPAPRVGELQQNRPAPGVRRQVERRRFTPKQLPKMDSKESTMKRQASAAQRLCVTYSAADLEVSMTKEAPSHKTFWARPESPTGWSVEHWRDHFRHFHKGMGGGAGSPGSPAPAEQTLETTSVAAFLRKGLRPGTAP